MDRNRHSGNPSIESTVFMDGEQLFKVSSTKRGSFMDGLAILRGPSTKSRVFVDVTKIF